MKAAQINAYGPPSVLVTTDDAVKPKPSHGQVLVEVRAAGVNPFDYKVRRGLFQKGSDLQLPATLGGDFAGVIAEGNYTLKPGDKVFGQSKSLNGQGSFAEFVAVNSESVAHLPDKIDFVTAAALPLAACSAYQAIVDSLQLVPGQKILIHGGAGGIGSLAVQIAKNIGAEIATTAASEDMEFVKSLGAETVIDYKTEDFSQMLKDYDAVFDTVGNETYHKSFKVLKPGGKIISMIETPDEELMAKYKVQAERQSSKVTTARLEAVGKLVVEGKLKVNVDKIFSLDEASEALAYLEQGKHRGKVVIKIKN